MSENEILASEKNLQEAALEYATLRQRHQGNAATGMVLITKAQARALRRLFQKAEKYNSGWNRINLRTPRLEYFRNIEFIGLESEDEEEGD